MKITEAVAATVAFAWMATFAFGSLLVETLLLYPNIFADVPTSLTKALEFMSASTPNDVLPPLGAATLATVAAAVLLTLRHRAVRLWTIGAALSMALGEFLFSAVWFWPRNNHVHRGPGRARHRLPAAGGGRVPGRALGARRGGRRHRGARVHGDAAHAPRGRPHGVGAQAGHRRNVTVECGSSWRAGGRVLARW
jgi:hypothetical protein